jgi:uncharacterized spore protein YtfJ
MNTIDEVVNTVVDHLGGTENSRAVAGEPLVVGDTTRVVLSTLSIGMGAGGGEGDGTPTTKQAKAGPGGGSGEEPAVVFDEFVERVPGLVQRVERARKAVEH